MAFIGSFSRDAIRARARLPWIRSCSRARRTELTEDGAATPGPADDGAPPQPEDDAVLLFVGGPLDGRVEIRPARHGEPLPTVTHVHLHDGPKVVHRYDLQPLADQAGVYHVRPTAPRPARTQPAPPSDSADD